MHYSLLYANRKPTLHSQQVCTRVISLSDTFQVIEFPQTDYIVFTSPYITVISHVQVVGLNAEWLSREGNPVTVLSSTMSGTGPKFNIFPTRMALTSMKNRMKGAQTGHSLLKRKSEALTRRFRDIVSKIDQVRILNKGKEKDGKSHANCILFLCGGQVFDGRYRIPNSGSCQIGTTKGRMISRGHCQARKCFRCYATFI
jgi:hypothetical protein